MHASDLHEVSVERSGVGPIRQRKRSNGKTKLLIAHPSVAGSFGGAARQNSLGFIQCPSCGVAVLQKHLGRHIKKVHPNSVGIRVSRPPEGLADATSRLTASPAKQLKNEIFQERLSRALDATKDYAHNFREGGRFGSHPAHDRFDDEGMP
jgi:hypothetical protein